MTPPAVLSVPFVVSRSVLLMVPDESDDDEDGAGSSAGKSSGKKERFFWQYNVQAKVRFLKSVNRDLGFLK